MDRAFSKYVDIERKAAASVRMNKKVPNFDDALDLYTNVWRLR
jgi:hypothetical protein